MGNAPDSSPIRKKSLSPLNTPQSPYTMLQIHHLSEKNPYHPSTPLNHPTQCSRFITYQRKIPIPPQHPSITLHNAPDSSPIREKSLSPLNTPQSPYTMLQIHHLSEKNPYPPSTPLN